MNRNLTLLEKTAKLTTNCFHNIDNGIREGVQITRENYEIFRQQLIGFMEYFNGRKVYILDLPANIIPHPENRRRMVDPTLANTPNTKTLSVFSQNFNNFYDITDKISEELDNNKEIFIYTIDAISVFSPLNFVPEFRYVVRYSTINMDYWYNPEYREVLNVEQNHSAIFNGTTTNTSTDNNKNKLKSIGESKLQHKF